MGARTEEEEESGGDSVRASVGIQAIADFFLKYHQDKDRDKEQEEEGGGPERDVGEGGGDQEEQGDYSGERVLSAAEQMSVDIMQRCVHHMAHHTPGVRLVVMETLQYCMEALRHDKVR